MAPPMPNSWPDAGFKEQPHALCVVGGDGVVARAESGDRAEIGAYVTCRYKDTKIRRYVDTYQA